MNKTPNPEPEGHLPEGFKLLIGTLLLVATIGFLSVWGLFA